MSTFKWLNTFWVPYHMLQVGEQRLTAHRIVLASTIPYFHAMFTSDMVESKQDEITMQGIEPRYALLKSHVSFYSI